MKTFTGLAHGRVNLIGEHTDYNGGFVLPTTIPQFTKVVLTPHAEKKVRVKSSADPKEKGTRDFTYELGQEKNLDSWTDYLAGATHLLAKAGHSIGGFTVEISSTVPEGSGLSSSAALEIAFLKAIRESFDLKLTDSELALIGQKIENEFVGARVGIMDQMACALARSGEALFLDTQDLSTKRIKLPLDQMDLLVINSGISHRLVGGGYNERRAQCEAACEALGIKLLRELEMRDLPKLEILPEVQLKRARHVITENNRVLQAVAAIEKRDLSLLGKLFLESHASMRDDYEVSLPEIDLLVKLCADDADVFGARLTGGGFGGSIVAITKKGKAKAVAAKVLPRYHEETGETASVLVEGEAGAEN